MPMPWGDQVTDETCPVCPAKLIRRQAWRDGCCSRECARKRQAQRRADRLEDYLWLKDQGVGVVERATRLGVKLSTLIVFLRRQGRHDLVREIERTLKRPPPKMTNKPCPVCGTPLNAHQAKWGTCCSRSCGQLYRQERERRESPW